MVMHHTKSGAVMLVYQWGHGKGTMPNPRIPATLIIDDGDGYFQQWRYTGKMADALECLASLERSVQNGSRVAVRNWNGYVLESVPDDFWIIDDSGCSEPNLKSILMLSPTDPL